VEINEQGRQRARCHAPIYRGSLLDWTPPRQWELAFTKGVLIHVQPDDLPTAYAKLVQAVEPLHPGGRVLQPHAGRGAVPGARRAAVEARLRWRDARPLSAAHEPLPPVRDAGHAPGHRLHRRHLLGLHQLRQAPEIDWQARREQLLELLLERGKNGARHYDCIVPSSGGKDSTTRCSR
jgi:hypothetical protein